MKVLVISGGENCISDFSADFFTSFDFIAACDKGYEYAKQAKLKPNLVLGDFDSCKKFPELQNLNTNITRNINGITFMKFPKEKDDPDTLLAVKQVLKMENDNLFDNKNKIDEIHIICALGNRFDHTFANIQTGNFIASCKKTAFIYGKNEKICIFSNSKMNFPKESDYYLSVFSVSDKAFGVTIKGAKYCVKDAVLENTFPIGQSNEWTEAASVEISVENGILAVVLSKI